MKKTAAIILAIITVLTAFTACSNIEYDDGSDEPDIYNSGTVNSEQGSDAASSASGTDDSSAAIDDSSAASEPESVAGTDDSSAFEDVSDTGAGLDFANGLIILGDRCMESFGGTYDSANYYAQVVAQYKKDLGDSVDVYSLVAPTSSSIYLRNVVRDGVDFYEKYGGSQAEKLDYLDEKFEGTGVKSVNVYDALYSHWDEQIYFRTDWHWTQLGAYYAAEKFAEVAGLDFKKLDSGYYTKNGKYNDDGSPKPFLGSLFNSAGSPAVLRDNPDEFFWYDFNHTYSVDYYDVETGKTLKATRDTCNLHISDEYNSAWYMTFLDADNNLCKINTGTNNGKTAVVFKDSFGNAFAPLLMSVYETVYVVDIRYYTGNSITFCKDVGATDVIFALSSFSAMGGNCKKIAEMRSR